MPVYNWNSASTDEKGVYKDRQSWITNANGELNAYKLAKLKNVNLPRNPMGRTGMSGRGALPQWGPNHHIFAVITRWQEKPDVSLKIPLEFVVTWFTSKTELSLPGGYVWSERCYETIQSIFKIKEAETVWESAQDMRKFFESFTSKDDMSYEKVCCGYMDDPLNTDQAWKEAEVCLIHYNADTSLHTLFQPNVEWQPLSEDVNLPAGQTVLLREAIDRFL